MQLSVQTMSDIFMLISSMFRLLDKEQTCTMKENKIKIRKHQSDSNSNNIKNTIPTTILLTA